MLRFLKAASQVRKPTSERSVEKIGISVWHRDFKWVHFVIKFRGL
jgi:hypothetical protein